MLPGCLLTNDEFWGNLHFNLYKSHCIHHKAEKLQKFKILPILPVLQHPLRKTSVGETKIQSFLGGKYVRHWTNAQSRLFGELLVFFVFLAFSFFFFAFNSTFIISSGNIEHSTGKRPIHYTAWNVWFFFPGTNNNAKPEELIDKI